MVSVKFFAVTIVFMLILSLCCFAAPASSFTVNNKPVLCDVAPEIINDRMMVPLRSFFESIKAEVSWNEKEQKVTIKGSKTIEITINSKTALVNGEKCTLDTAPYLKDMRTMIPARFVSETLGCLVDWDDSKNSCNITTPSDVNIIKNIESTAGDKDYTVYINFSAQSKKIETMILSEPDRFVVDVYGLMQSESKTFSVNNTYIKQIRTGFHGDYTRIVFDLNKSFKYNSRLINNAWTLEAVFSGGGKPIDVTPAPTQKPTQTPLPAKTPASDTKPSGSVDFSKYTVVVDAGHGGKDSGAVYKYADGRVLMEKDFNLKWALLTADMLREKGVNVIMTRDTDTFVTLQGRCDISNSNSADLFVSIHTNSFSTSSPNGSLVFYSPYKDNQSPAPLIKSGTLSKYILTRLAPAIGTVNLGPSDGAEYIVIKNTETTAVLVESGFISNEHDRNILLKSDTAKKIASSISDGVIEALTVIDKLK